MNFRSLTRFQVCKFVWNYRDAVLLLIVALAAAVWLWPSDSVAQKTSRDLDIAIVGEGYFQISTGSQICFTRKGRFTQNANGELYFGNRGNRHLLEPTITIPPDATAVHVYADGRVTVEQSGSSRTQDVGILQLVRFPNPRALQEVAPGLFTANKESGEQIVCEAGVDGMGIVRQGWLEGASQFQNADSSSVFLAILCGCIGWLFLEVRSLRRRLAMNAEPEPVTLKFPASSSALTQRREAA